MLDKYGEVSVEDSITAETLAEHTLEEFLKLYGDRSIPEFRIMFYEFMSRVSNLIEFYFISRSVTLHCDDETKKRKFSI